MIVIEIGHGESAKETPEMPISVTVSTVLMWHTWTHVVTGANRSREDSEWVNSLSLVYIQSPMRNSILMLAMIGPDKATSEHA